MKRAAVAALRLFVGVGALAYLVGRIDLDLARGTLAAAAPTWLVAAMGLTIDLWTKAWAFSDQLEPKFGRVIIPHFARFQRSLNTSSTIVEIQIGLS